MFLILITIKQASWVGERAMSKSLGTWVRIPGPPKHLFDFSSGDSMWYPKGDPPYACKYQPARWPPGQIWWIGMRVYHILKSTSMHWMGKVKQGWQLLGLENCKSHLQIRPTPPELFLLLFIVSSIYFVLIFILSL